MSRRKLRLRTNDLKELRVKPVPTWCINRSHMIKAKEKQTTTFKKKKKIRRTRVTSCANLLIIGQEVSKSQRKKTST
jgi:hypothetical protein